MLSKAAKVIFLVIISLLALLFIIWVIAGLVYESGDWTIEELDQPIENFYLNAEYLDACLRDRFPDDCGNKDFSELDLDVSVQNGRMQEGTLTLTYYALLNAQRQGGNVATVTFEIDPISGSINRIKRYHGTAKGLLYYSDPILKKTIDFPLAFYVENLAILAKIPDSQQAMLHLRSTKWGLAVRITDASETLYKESVDMWDSELGPEYRIVTELCY